MSKKTLTILIVVGLVFVGVMIWVGQTEAPAPTEDPTATTTDDEVPDISEPVPGTPDVDNPEEDSTSTDETSDAGPADDSDSMVDDEPDSTMHNVSYTSDGFSPSTVEVQVGDTVVWQSEDGSSMWVASAMHPTHEVYQGTTRSDHCSDGAGPDAFDQCERGERYEFTFEKSGEWGYHNHVQAGHTGKVVVTE